MSDVSRRIITIFEARGGNVLTTLRGISSGFMGASQGTRQWARDVNYLNSQWRAFATTFRYAIAGTTLYGLAGTVSQLAQVQQQLGQISAIGEVSGPGGGGLLLVGQRLDNLAASARQASVDTIRPISEINDAIINLLSTAQNIPQNQIVPIVEEIGKAATISLTPVNDLSTALTAMQVSFRQPINLGNIRRSAQEFFMLIRRAPGGPEAGRQLIGQFGQLANVAQSARVSQPEMFALLTSVLRTGIPPAQTGRGLTFLLQTLGQPANQTKAAQQALASLGITATNRPGGIASLGRIFDKVKALGLQPASKDQLRSLSTLEEQIGGDTDVPAELISGRGAQFAATIFRRVHAYRTFLALYSRWIAQNTDQLPNLTQEIKDYNEAWNGHVKDVENLNKAFQRFKDQAKLQEAANALQVLGLEVANIFEPVLNLAARGITATTKAAQTDEGHKVLIGILAGLGGLGLFKTGRSILGSIGRRGPTAAITAMNIGGETGQWKGIPGESPTNPSFVVMVGSLGGPGGGWGRYKGKTPPGPMGEPIPKPPLPGASKPFLGIGIGATSVGVGTALGLLLTDMASGGNFREQAINEINRVSGSARLANIERRRLSGGKLSMTEKRAVVLSTQSIPAAEAYLNAMQGGVRGSGLPFAGIFQKALHNRFPNQIVGQAHVTMDINITDQNGGKSTQRKGVTIDLVPSIFKQHTQKAPLSRGKSTTRRGGL